MTRLVTAVPIFATLLFAGGGALHSARADAPYGTYMAQGNKGAITLKLTPGEDGSVTGTLSGGSFNAKLEGDTEDGVTTGVIVDARDEVIGDFRVTRTAAGVVLELGEESEEGQFTPKNRLVFASARTGTGSAGGWSGGSSGGPSAPSGGSAPNGSYSNGNGYGGNSSGGIRKGGSSGSRAPSGGAQWHRPVVAKSSGGTGRGAARPAARPAYKPAYKPVTNPAAPQRAGHRRTGGTAVASGGPAAGASNWKIYKHAVGISMRYPSNWKLHQAGEALQIIPPDVLMVGGQAREIYVAFADGGSGVTSAGDPRVVQLLDQKMQGFAPFLQRTGEPQSASAGTLPGIKVTWEGTNPAGMQVLAHMYVVIMKGYGVGVLAMGDSKRIAARETTVRAMFSSLAASSESRDARLAGYLGFLELQGQRPIQPRNETPHGAGPGRTLQLEQQQRSGGQLQYRKPV